MFLSTLPARQPLNVIPAVDGPWKSVVRSSLGLRRSALGSIRRYWRTASKEKGSILPLSQKDAFEESGLMRKEVWVTGGWWLLWCNVVLLGVVTLDVCSTDSIHLFQPVDHGIHAWVVGHITMEYRDYLFGAVLSDFGIAFPLIAWVCLDLLTSPRNLQSILTDVRSSANVRYGITIVSVEGLSTLAKEVFHRTRPRPDIGSFSYPSGHTLTAVMVSGIFLFFKLHPYCRKHNVEQRLPRWMQLEALLACAWVFCGCITAAGRIGGDAHWLTDTLAGGAMGAMTVSSLWLRGKH